MNWFDLNSITLTWLSGAITVGMVVAYELLQHWRHRHHPLSLARTAHANLREDWFRSINTHVGSELLAIQTLRNSLMSATLTATTATLGLMGTVTLTASSWVSPTTTSVSGIMIWPAISPRLGTELALMLALFITLTCAVMAVRSFSHASFIGAMPSGSAIQKKWFEVGVVHVRKAGELYSWSLRVLLMCGPMVASMAHPLAGPVAALGLIFALWRLDRVPQHSQTH